MVNRFQCQERTVEAAADHPVIVQALSEIKSVKRSLSPSNCMSISLNTFALKSVKFSPQFFDDGINLIGFGRRSYC